MKSEPTSLSKVDAGLATANVVAWAFMCLMNALSTAGAFGPSNSDVSDWYPLLITPAGSAFSIWGLIFALIGIFVIKALVQTLRRQPPSYLRVISPFFLLNMLSNAFWSLSFAQEAFAVCLALIVVAFLTLVVMRLILYSHSTGSSSLSYLLCGFGLFRSERESHTAFDLPLRTRTSTSQMHDISDETAAAGSTPASCAGRAKAALGYLGSLFGDTAWCSVYLGWITCAMLINILLVVKYGANGSAHDEMSAGHAPVAAAPAPMVAPSATHGEFVNTAVSLGAALVVALVAALGLGDGGIPSVVCWASGWILKRASDLEPHADAASRPAYEDTTSLAQGAIAMAVVFAVVGYVGGIVGGRGLLPRCIRRARE
eukprot:TRINITY_DN57_c0_g1_i1.p1 TRINITY_DN57_c0_g1~~TRINITY_DN57_c0_g1_i1.p1  ORF type:complete len:372 (+),score=74.52 TRINITY_DN57_c0_g1_i1:134-1249(+)